MVFYEDGRDVAQIAIRMREPRVARPSGDALQEVAVVGGEYEGAGDMARGFQRRIDRRPPLLVEPGADFRRPREAAVPTMEAKGDVVLVIDAVSHMEIEVQGRM